MRTWISDWDKTNITQAWVVITCVMISLALGSDEVNADNVDRSNSTSNETTHSQDGFNAPFSFLMPRIGDPLNSTESPELTTQNQKQTVPLTTTLKVSNATLVGNSAATGLTKQEVISSTTAQSEITTNQAIYSSTITDIAPTVNSTTTPLLKTTSTQTSTQTRNNSSISKSTVKSGQTNNTSALESFSSSDLTSISTSGSMSFSTSGPKYTDSSTVTNTQTVTNAKLIQTTQSSRLATVNSTDETYNSTADPSRLTRTFSDDFQSPDSFWPIALALTIGIPTIVVLAITITVLYRRRMAKPRSLLSMYGQDYFNN